MDINSSDQNTSHDDEQEIITWLQRNSIPLQNIEAGHGFTDLQPFKTLLKDVQVVGLGETTHGTREFFQMKHRLFEFLVIEMNFTAFTLEASFAACQPINDYVLHGTGDRAAALTGQGYIPWDSEEFADLLDWLRKYNQSVPTEKRVQFFGLDVWRNDIGRIEVLDFLSKVAPDRLGATQVLFQDLTEAEAKWPRRINEEIQKALVQMLPRLHDLIAGLSLRRDELVRSSSQAEFTRMMQYLRVMEQWLEANAATMLPDVEFKNRSIFMAENLMFLMDQAGPGAKFVIWAHNAHITNEGYAVKPNLGSYLREKLGKGYFAFGFEFGEGSFLARKSLPENLLGDLQEVIAPPAPAGSIPWFLSRADLGDSILNLNAPAGSPAVEQWLHTPRIMQHANWVCDEPNYYKLCLAEQYDGLIFIERTTAIRPTQNAINTAANRMWL